MEHSPNNSSSNLTSVLTIPALLVSVLLYALLVILSLTGNCLVIMAFRNNAKLRTVSNYFIISLAASDLLISVVTLPLWILHILLLFLINRTDFLYKLWMFSDVIGGGASIFSLSMISYERYLCISTALVKPLYLTKSKAKIYLAVVWLLATGFASLRCAFYDIPKPVYEISLSLICFFLPLLFIGFNYLRIFKLASYQAHKMNANFPSKMGHNILMKELKAAKTIGIVIGLFFVCWTPFFVLNLLYGLCACRAKVSVYLILAAKWFHYFNSVLNPFIYALRHEDFKAAFDKVHVLPLNKISRVKYRRPCNVPEIEQSGPSVETV